MYHVEEVKNKQTNKKIYRISFPTEMFQSRMKTPRGMFTDFYICLEINTSLKKEDNMTFMVLYED